MPWLLATCGGGIAATLIIGHFESTLEKLVFMAAFIPVIMGMGGNIGTQSATIVVRGLATASLQIHRLGAVVLKEMAVGFLLGFVYGVLLGALAHIGYQMWPLGRLVALAVVFTMTMAAVRGALLPMTFARLKIVPAVAPGPFVTTAIDILSISFLFLSDPLAVSDLTARSDLTIASDRPTQQRLGGEHGCLHSPCVSIHIT